MAYDVFISYRRETGADDARLLQQALKARGYNVFFDYDSLRDGKFDEKIFEAIDEASVFVLMLTERALDRCVNADDWVRLEIERALSKGKKVVLVAPSNQEWSFPEQLPDSLLAIKEQLIFELNKASLFEESFNRIIENCFHTPLNPSHVPSAGEGRIFISYSRKDYDVVIRLRDEIHRCTGVLPWMDVSGIETGTQFADKIATAIDECQLFVFVISPNSVVSHWTTKEVLYAQEQRKKIYPVIIEDVRLPRKLALLFADVDRVDIQKPAQREKFFWDITAFCGECVYVKTPTRNIHDTQATSPRLPPRHKVISSVKEQSEGTLVTCPVCGKKNAPVDTFRCRECGRENLCIRHQNEKTYLCCDCMEMSHAEDDSLKMPPRQHMAVTVVPKTFNNGDTLVTRGQKLGQNTEHYLKGELLLRRYEVLAILGRGGTGCVYKCLDRIGGGEVAVKVLPPAWSRDLDAEESIRENFRLISGLRYPGIVGLRALEYDRSTGSYFLVMDLAPGMNLRNWADAHRAKRHFQEKLKIIAEIAVILDYAHSRGVLHRDVKPENIAIDDHGGVHVFDFGIASQTPSADPQIGQGMCSLSGTPSYMSPEQWRGQPQDAATDQYSLAVLSYELISGSLPFVASDITSLMSRVMSEPIALIQGVSNHVNVALVRALAKDPRERFASCKEFADALEGKEVRKKVSLLTKFAVGVAAVSAGVLLPLKKK